MFKTVPLEMKIKLTLLEVENYLNTHWMNLRLRSVIEKISDPRGDYSINYYKEWPTINTKVERVLNERFILISAIIELIAIYSFFPSLFLTFNH